MADMRLFKANHERAKFRLAQPFRHLAAKHAAFGFRADLALAGDDEHESQALAMCPVQKARQRAMRSCLRHAMQVKTSIDLLAPARKLRPLAAAERRQW